MVSFKSFSLLNTYFHLVSSRDNFLHHIDAFLASYIHTESLLKLSSQVTVEISEGFNSSELPWEGKVKFHNSPYRNWDREAAYLNSNGKRVVRLLDLPIEIITDSSLHSVSILVGDGVDPMQVGEIIFTACRNIAIYQRLPDCGVFAHASVVSTKNLAIAFSGPSGCGKTSFFIEAVLRFNLRPISNDRALLCWCEKSLQCCSWPSYFTITESMLCMEPLLHKQAIEYERDYYYRTTTWTNSPNPSSYSKRLYPMHWFVEAAGVKYNICSPLSSLIIFPLEKSRGPTRLIPINSKIAASKVISYSFDSNEPSFPAWHAAKLPAVQNETHNRLSKALEVNNVRCFSLQGSIEPVEVHRLMGCILDKVT